MRVRGVAVEARFRAVLSEHAGLGPGGRVVVALSGGLDSCVLLHLMRFHVPAPQRPELVVAHFDHGMRPSSTKDALWVRGLCQAWGVPVRLARAHFGLSSEEAARDARYDFLEAVRSDVGANLVLTAHHADDQAETVLFRVLRGTGKAGLAGIPRGRDPFVFRPLLGFWREELERYAERSRVSWRDDPSNRLLRYARNVLRRRVLPDVEHLVAPGARRALVRLAELAQEDEAGWESLMPGLLEPLDVARDEDRVSIERKGLVRLHPAVAGRVLRRLAREAGRTLDEKGTRLAVAFASSGGSGSAIDLGDSVELRRELNRLVLGPRRTAPVEEDRPLEIPDAGPGSGDAIVAGRRVPVAWGLIGAVTGVRAARFDPDGLRFPLLVRSRKPGDRIRLRGGTKKVKKLFLERRIPHARRLRVPLVVDARGDVLWIPGVARAEWSERAAAAGLTIGIG